MLAGKVSRPLHVVPGSVGQNSLGPVVSLKNLLYGVSNVPKKDYEKPAGT